MVRRAKAGRRRSIIGDGDDGFREGLWGFLRQIVAYATLDDPVLMLA